MNRMKVLLVDNHTIVRDGLALLLKTLDPSIEVVVTAEYQGALRLPTEQMPNVILIDFGFADMTSLAAITLLRGRYPNIPIIVLSGPQDRKTVCQAIENGATAFIPNSCSADMLIGALRLVLVNKEIYVSPGSIGGSEQKLWPLDHAKITTPESLGLTPRQAHVLYLVLQGKSTKAIAKSLRIQVNTVRTHLGPVLRSLNANTRYEAIVTANKIGLQFNHATEWSTGNKWDSREPIEAPARSD